MSSRDEVLIRVRMQGGKAAAKDIAAAEKQLTKLKKTSQDRTPESNSMLGRLSRGLRAIGPGSAVATGAIGQFRRTTSGLASDVGGAVSTVGRLTAAITGLSAAGAAYAAGSFVRSGIGFNADFQSAEASFTTMLGTMEKSKAFVESLREVSNGSPLRLTEVMDSAKQLLGFGMNADQAKASLIAMNKAVLAQGGGSEQFRRIGLVLGQISAKGKVSAEELLQLAEAGIPANKILQEQLGLTAKQVANIGNEGVPAAAGLWALTKGWNETFGKAAENARGTFKIQTAQMRKDWEQFQRVTTEPLFKYLNKNVLPDVSKALTNATKTASRKDLTTEQKVRIGWKGVKRDLGPLAKELKQGIDSLHLGDRVREGIEEDGPKIVNALGTAAEKAAPKIAGALWKGWKSLGTGGKALTAVWLLRRLRFPFWGAGAGGAKLLARGLRAGGGKALGPVGRSLGSGFGRVFRRSAASSGSPANWSLGQWAKNGRFAGVGTTLGVVMGAAMAAAVIDQLTAKVTGKSISQRLREGMTGKGAPGTERFDPTITPKEAKRRGLTAKQLRENRERNTGTGAYAPGGAVAEALLPKAEREALQRRRRRAARKARGRWTGGTVQPGEVTVAGEHGPELAKFAAVTQIVPTHRWDAPSSRGRSESRGGRERVRTIIKREQPIIVQVGARELLRTLSVQAEREALAH